MRRLCIGVLLGLARSEEQRKQNEYRCGAGGRHEPDLIPGVAVPHAEGINDAARGPGADEHADTPRDECEKSLRSGPEIRSRAAIDVDLSGDEEEVVADAVKEDAQIQHPDL